MKAITLWQPWASLMALRFKQIETRDWPTRYRGPIAIHASIRWTREEQETARSPIFAEALTGSAVVDHGTIAMLNELPRGAVIGVGYLAACRQVDLDTQPPPPRDTYERAFGFYAPERWMWWIRDIRMLREPIPAKGAQGLWNWTPPADLREMLLDPLPLRAMEEVSLIYAEETITLNAKG